MPRLSVARPEEIGLDSARLNEAAHRLQQWTTGERPAVPAGGILVGRRGKIVAPRVFGRMGPEPDAEPIRPDAMFLLASITKPVVYLAAMKLVERGMLNLTDRVSRYIPDFAAHHKEETLVLHLFTHTSGLPDNLPNNVELRRKHAPLKAFIDETIHCMPLFPPGTDLSYQSMGTLMVAELVQRLTGQTIHEFVRKEVLQPLEMTSTGLGSRGFPRARLVRVQVPEWQEGTDFGWNSSYWQELGAPWGGMFSTLEDFAVLCQMLLRGGALEGVRILSPATVERMTTNRLVEQPDLPEPVRRARPWGLGWRLNHPGASDSWGDLLGPRVFGHTGATGTLVWMDPDRDGFCILFTSAIRAAAPWRLVQLSNMVASAFL